jgi:SAM-dependent methyltransferase
MRAQIKEYIPWWLKIGAKIVLSRLRLPYHHWRTLGLFQHGFMLDPEYAVGVFDRHYARAKARLPPAYTVLELGPGDSLATALVAAAHGAEKVWLVDAGVYASQDIEAYRPLCQRLASSSNGVRYHSVSHMLEATHATYLTNGLASLHTIPADSVDLIFSQAVLEHVAWDEFNETIHELHRVQRPGGVSSHRIDLQDHLAHGLNSLRFSRALWESDLFAKSGFYTNRLRASQIVAAFTAAGYALLSRQDDRWPTLPLPRRRLHPDYAAFPEDDLLVRGLDLVVQKPR